MSDDKKHLDIVTGGSDTKPKPPPVRTREEAINYLDASLRRLLQARANCDVIIPNNVEATVAQQQKNMRKFLIHVGKLMGESAFAFAMGLIEQETYERFHMAALNSMAAKVVGIIGL